MNVLRGLRHLLAEEWQMRRAFPRRVLRAIERAVAEQEKRHQAELRFAVEGGLPLSHLLHGQCSRARAHELFGALGVWDTEHNSGVLIYLLLADRAVEIVADRGIHRCVGNAALKAICRQMEISFAKGEFERGAVAGIAALSDLLAEHFPSAGDKHNELPDKTVIL
jgi:hypothetical protein